MFYFSRRASPCHTRLESAAEPGQWHNGHGRLFAADEAVAVQSGSGRHIGRLDVAHVPIAAGAQRIVDGQRAAAAHRRHSGGAQRLQFLAAGATGHAGAGHPVQSDAGWSESERVPATGPSNDTVLCLDQVRRDYQTVVADGRTAGLHVEAERRRCGHDLDDGPAQAAAGV